MSTNTQTTLTMGGREWLMLLVLSLLWGGSFFFTGIAVRELPSFTLVALRVGIGAIALWLMLHALGQRMPRDGRVWAAFFAMGLLNNVIPFSLFAWGQHHIASGLAAILNATTPLFGVLVAHALTEDERLTPAKAVGVTAGFVGVVVLMGPDALHGLGSGTLAQFACLSAALTYAFAGIFGRRFRRMGIPPMVTATGQVTASSVMLLPLALLVEHPWTLLPLHAATWAAVVGLGVLSTAVAYVLYFRVLATAGATNVLLVTLLIPVSAILLGVLVLGESLLPRHFLGMALIGAGLGCIDGRPLRVLSRCG